MKTIRIGNDIQVNWYITRFGQPEDFSNKNLSVALIDKFNNKQVFDYSIDGNKISGIFYGKNQKTNGVYRLLLQENEGDTDMVTLDYIDCFCLSNKLKNQTSIGTDTTSSINTEVIELDSEITTTPDLSKYAKIDYVNGKVLMLQNEISANTEYIDTLSGNVNTISGNVNTISGNVNTISGNVNTINNKVNTISGNVNTISGNVNTISGNVNNIESRLANKADLVNGTVPTNELPFATITTNGSIKLYNVNGINRSGLLLQEDGGLLVNTSQDKGLYRDGVGQLHANIKGAATDEEIDAKTSAIKALTPSNIDKLKTVFTSEIITALNQINQRLASLEEIYNGISVGDY